MVQVPTRAPSPAPRRTAAAPLRTDIQGLRALAVSLVLIYHLWPSRLSGGFAGVDVFFVISGFLITSHLVAHPPAGGRDLARFWTRRIKRLLPAALLVLTVTLLASRLLAPDTQWLRTARETAGAALYSVNWTLAADSVDYLAAADPPTPVQHYWSLSVEEQFYLVWPILVLLLVALTRWRRITARTALLLGLGAVTLGSLWYSVAKTASDPATAYFVTPTRMWELGVGGLLAVLLSRTAPDGTRSSAALPLPPAARTAITWIGLGAIVATAVTYSGATPFPGWQAALPVLGAAAVIAAYPLAAPLSPGGLLALRPVQWLGDVSYSVYLWHWPLVVLVPFLVGGALGPVSGLGVVAATLVLAALSKRYVEEPLRTREWRAPLRTPFLLAAAAGAAVVALAALQVAEVHRNDDAARAALAAAVQGGGSCFGAAALGPGSDCPRTVAGTIVPAPALAADDKSDAYADVSGGKDCWSYVPDFPTVTCTFGDPHGRVSLALVGNSHAGQWLPALQVIAAREHWRITTYLASRCAMSTTLQQFPTAAQSAACEQWARRTATEVADAHPDLIVMTNRMSVSAVGASYADSGPAYQAGYESVLRTWARAGIPVVGIRDTPAPAPDVPSVPECLAAHPGHYDACSGTRAQWLPADPLPSAVAAVHDPDVRVVDLTDRICGPEVCDAAVGGVTAYFDGSHLTATYNRTLAPYLRPALDRALAR